MDTNCELISFKTTGLSLEYIYPETDEENPVGAKRGFEFKVEQHPEERHKFRGKLCVRYEELSANQDAVGMQIIARNFGILSFNPELSDAELKEVTTVAIVQALHQRLNEEVEAATQNFPRGPFTLSPLTAEEILEDVPASEVEE